MYRLNNTRILIRGLHFDYGGLGMTERDADSEALDLRLIRVLYKATKVLYARLAQDIEGHGLSLETFQIMELLYNKGPRTVQEIGEKFSIPSGSITYVIDKLEKKGLAERLAIPGDRRKTNVALTGEGRGSFDTIFPKHVRTIADHLSFATETEKLELIRVLKKIGYGIRNADQQESDRGI